MVEKPLPFVEGLTVWLNLSVSLNVGFGFVLGCLKKSWVVVTQGPEPQAGWDFCISVLPYLLDDPNLDWSIWAYLVALKPFVESPKIFLASLVWEKLSFDIGVYPFAWIFYGFT